MLKNIAVLIGSLIIGLLTIAPSAFAAGPNGQSFLQQEIAQGGNCTLIVPANPLSPAGLATPYVLDNDPNTPNCTMANAVNLGAFVQATILDPATGNLFVYNPLVITQGTTPAVAPVVPALPAGAIVTVSTGFNGNLLTLAGPGSGAFVQGTPDDQSPFGQVAVANGPQFFALAAGKAKVPPLGTAKDGMTCPTTRDFSLVDQDPSDNVTAHYLVNASGQTAQNNAANAAMMPGAAVVGNGSDNNLLANFVDPALGCTPFTAPDLSNNGAPSSSQALNELQANAFQQTPALVPVNDPMTTVNADIDIIPNDFPNPSNFSVDKTNLYRANVGQPALVSNNGQDAAVMDAKQFCAGLATVGAPRVAMDAQFEAGPSPMAGMTLAQFLAQRLTNSSLLLACHGNAGQNGMSQHQG